MASSKHESASASNLQALNWNGCIPIVVTLAPSSLSSPTLPPPIHVLVSRHTFLHTGLEDAVRRLHQFAPTTVSFRAGLVRKEPGPGSGTVNEPDSDDDEPLSSIEAKKEEASPVTTETPSINASTTTAPYPICWFEDEDSQTALRWNLFTGVLYDLMKKNRTTSSSRNEESSSSSSSSSTSLPWRIRLHFTAAYPTSQILPLDSATPVILQVWNFYKNSLKQALCLQYGNSKAAMNLTKENHGRLWDAVRRSNFGLYHQVHNDFSSLSLSSSLQRPFLRLPTRILVDSKPPRQASALFSDALTLGMLLAQQLPNHFVKQDSSAQPSSSGDETAVVIIAKEDCVLDWSVAGVIKPPLDIPVATLWENLCHPDHFLYILVHTIQSSSSSASISTTGSIL